MSLISDRFPCFVWACPSVKEKLDSPNLSTAHKVAEIAKAIFSHFFLPIISLLGDAIYNLCLLASACCGCFRPNVRIRENQPDPPQDDRIRQVARESIPSIPVQEQALPVEEPAIPSSAPAAEISADNQFFEPSIVQAPPEDLHFFNSLVNPVFAREDSYKSEGKDDFEEILPSEAAAYLSYNKNPYNAALGALSRTLFDPANPEKGKKYLYPLHAMRESLRTFRQEINSFKKTQPFDSESFDFHALAVIEKLQNFQEEPLEVREIYAHVLNHLRAALEKLPFSQNEPIKQILLNLCSVKFSGVYLYPFIEDFISKTLYARQNRNDSYQLPTEFTLQTIAQDLREANLRLKSVSPEYQQALLAKETKKLQGTFGFDFDPTRGSNTPWVHSIQKSRRNNEVKEIAILRHGTPTADTDMFGILQRESLNLLRSVPIFGSSIAVPKSSSVIPEYEGYLLANPQKNTLYINHQEYDESDNKPVHAELARSNAIRDLENRHKNFHFLALPLDGPIWNEKFLTSSIHSLKQKLFSAILNQEEGFGLPSILQKDANLPKRIEEMIEHVHILYFDGSELTTKEKRAFILLVYSELKDFIKETSDINFVVSACKDNKDRGNASTLVDMMKNLVKLGLEQDSNQLREVFYSALAPFIIKNEEIIPSRLELALNVFEHLSSLTETQKQKIRACNFTGFSIIEQSVPKEPCGPSQMMNATMFQKSLEWIKKERRIVMVPNFHSNVISDFYKNDTWDLPKLQKQIKRDLYSIDIRYNGKRITDFGELIELFKLSQTFEQGIPKTKEESLALEKLALLHQGVVGETMKDPASYLNGNPLGLFVAQQEQTKARITVQLAVLTCFKGNEQQARAVLSPDLLADSAPYLAYGIENRLLPASFQDLLPTDKIISPQPIYPTRIYLHHGKEWELEIQQELELSDPAGRENLPDPIRHPILLKAFVNGHPASTICWEFIPELAQSHSSN